MADRSNTIDWAGNTVQAKALTINATAYSTTTQNWLIGAGSATVAPLTFTSGTLLTTAAAGVIEYDGTTFYGDVAASTRGVIGPEQFCVLTADYAATDTASAQQVFNSTAAGAVTLPSSTTYFIDAVYKISNTGTTSHTWSTLFAGTATLTDISYTVLSSGGATSAATLTTVSRVDIGVATAVAVTAASTSATEFVTLAIHGKVAINAGGTFIPQIKASAQPGASGTPGVTVLKGSYIRLVPVGIKTVATVGNWS